MKFQQCDEHGLALPLPAALLVRDWITVDRDAHRAWTAWCMAELRYFRGEPPPPEGMKGAAQQLRREAEALREEGAGRGRCGMRSRRAPEAPPRPRGMSLASEPIQVVVADQHHLVRAGLSTLLSLMPGVQVLAELHDTNEVLALLESVTPDVVTTDISMPRLDGLAAIRKMRSRHPSVHVIAVSACESTHVVRHALACGACAFVHKQAPARSLEQAVRDAIQGRRGFAIQADGTCVEMSSLDSPLTPRQLEILALLAQGKSSKQIAWELGLSTGTVGVHRSRIADRLGIRGAAGLTRYALEQGLAPAEGGESVAPSTRP